jgi:hypothetical protein
MIGVTRLLIAALSASAWLFAAAASAQDAAPQPVLPDLPDLSSYAPATSALPLAMPGPGEITLAAQLTPKGAQITRGLVWRVFGPQPGPDGKLPLIASAQGGSNMFQLAPGSYLVHASFGRAGATKRITVGREGKQENIVLDAGGLKLNAMLPGGKRIAAAQLKFSIYEAKTNAKTGGALIIPNVNPNTVVRLNSGTYQVVSTYGTDNAVIRSDLRVEAGKLTEAMIEHHAAELTMKLVREPGGEAIADTSWSVVTASGDTVRDIVGAYAPMVLAEGEYTVIAKNRDKLYQRELKVESGHNEEVELIANEAAAAAQVDEAD